MDADSPATRLATAIARTGDLLAEQQGLIMRVETALWRANTVLLDTQQTLARLDRACLMMADITTDERQMPPYPAPPSG
jgi:hypothetical protein